eukprot:scaffold203_cov42-Phaeocystis_antarctica.AAC.2
MPHEESSPRRRLHRHVPESISHIVLGHEAAFLDHSPHRPDRGQVERQGVVKQVGAVLVVLAGAVLVRALVHHKPG